MLYLEDEDNVRPSWMPYKNDFRQLRTDDIGTVEDADAALLWLDNRITDLHAWAEKVDDADHRRFWNRQISRALAVKREINRIRAAFWQESKREFWKEDRAHKSSVKARARQDIKRMDAHRTLLAAQQAASAEKHALRMQRVRASAQRNELWHGNFKRIVRERFGTEAYEAICREASERTDAEGGAA